MTQRVYIAGHSGMVGSAIHRQLLHSGYQETDIILRTHAELDLTQQAAVDEFFQAEQPTHVYLARVGAISGSVIAHMQSSGIQCNTVSVIK